MLWLALVVAGLSPSRLYVASMTGADGGPGTSSHPFKTVERAIKELNGAQATVFLRGRFTLRQQIELGPSASNATFCSWGRDRAVISGGVELTNWQPQGNLWVAKAPPAPMYRNLWVETLRKPQATLPKHGFLALDSLLDNADKGPWNAGQDAARFHNTDIRQFTDLADVEFVAHHYWIQSRMRIRSLEPNQHIVRFDRKSVFRLTDDYTGSAAPYRLQNLREALTEPGEWVYDSKTSSISYLPTPDERKKGPTSLHAYVGRLSCLARVTGANNLTFRDIEFRNTEWEPPKDSAGDWQGAATVPAAIQVVDSENVKLDRCGLQNLAGYGIEIAGRSRNCSIQRCRIQDAGGGGIKLASGTDSSTIENNILQHLGRVFESALGIYIADSGHNVITHNRIEDLYYTAISVGWVWGYGPSKGAGNRIEANDIKDVGQGELSDMGGIYTLGISPGTVLRGNRIQNVKARGYGGWGIYLDEGTSNMLVENNLVMDTKTGGFHQHYGRDNIIRNNAFLRATQDGQIIRSRKEDHLSFTFEHNVVIWSGTDALGSNWDGGVKLLNNVWWRTDGVPSFAGKSFADWQKLGYEQGSVVANPLAEVSKAGIRFKKGSPAARLGILPIDMRQVGPTSH